MAEAMKRIFLVLPLSFACTSPVEAQMNPYQIGMQYCQMVNSGMSRDRAWDYVIQTYSNTSPYGLNRGDPYAPWSPTRTLGGAIGSGLASGLMLGMQLRGMKNDIERVVNQNCPAGYKPGTDELLMPVPAGASLDSYCTWNPWEEKCKNGTFQNTQKQEDCLKALEKFDCKYGEYLKANPHMEKWVEANPEMARKEALRLKAIDANEIGKLADESNSDEQKTESVAGNSTKDHPEANCLKAADYKGCMEYHDKN